MFCLSTYGASFKSLGLNDFEYEKFDRERPAVTSVAQGPEHKSFNQWSCFDRQDIEIRTIDIQEDSNERRGIPVLLQYNASGPGETLQFEPADLHHSTQQVLQVWKYLVSEATEVCVYAAKLQSFDDGLSIWLISQLKSDIGYWVDAQVNEDSCGEELYRSPAVAEYL